MNRFYFLLAEGQNDLWETFKFKKITNMPPDLLENQFTLDIRPRSAICCWMLAKVIADDKQTCAKHVYPEKHFRSIGHGSNSMTGEAI